MSVRRSREQRLTEALEIEFRWPFIAWIDGIDAHTEDLAHRARETKTQRLLLASDAVEFCCSHVPVVTTEETATTPTLVWSALLIVATELNGLLRAKVAYLGRPLPPWVNDPIDNPR
jgi:hypothetical protein